MASRRKKRRQRQLESTELELMPMLNVFISIIPLLLLGAAFVPVSVIKTTLPTDAVAAVSAVPADAPVEVLLFVRPGHYVIQVNGAVSQTISRGAATAADSASVREMLLTSLKQIAEAHTGPRDVRIVAEPTTHYQDIIEAMDLTRAAGLPEAALSEAAPEGS
jgi:biopolymer transport protein ExbD